MIPRRKSIFHLAEEGDARCHHQYRSLVGAGSRGVREGLVVGLQIIVHDDAQHQPRRRQQKQQQHGRDARAASIVLKQMVKAAAAPLKHGAVPCSFLKACSLCRMELSPLTDVYMYRGDQGFCSEECRRHQIVVDEAQERRGLQPHHHRRRTPILRGTPGKTMLTVA